MAVAPKGTKRACPAIRPCASLRVRSLHRRSEGRLTRAIPGPLSLSPHPCGSPLYATIPLTLLKGRLALPESPVSGSHALRGNPSCDAPRHRAAGCTKYAMDAERRGLHSHAERGNDQRACAKRQEKTTGHLGARLPVRRPSGGVAQGDEPHGCGERLKGPWMALVSRPPARHRKEGSLAAGQTRMPGWPSLWLLSLGQTRESDSP